MALRPAAILSLCSGVGGLELGIRLALPHARTICHVEREAAAAASLVASMEAGWFHPAPVWSDLTTFDARPWRGLVSIIASGDPCQDNSVAGKRAGAGGERFLAPEVVRIAQQCRPDIIFRENVPGNADGQLHAIVPPLERLGYRVAAGIFSSAETGNTMRRERLFIMAVREDEPWWLGAGPEREYLSDAGGRGGELARPAGGGFGMFGPTPEPGSVRHSDRSVEGCRGQLGGAAHERHKRSGPARRRGNGPADAGEPLGRAAGEGSLPGAHGGLHCGEEGGGPRDAEPQRRGREMGSTSGAEPQGQQRGQHLSSGRQVKGGHSLLSGGAVLPPAVIPGPTDSRWIDVLDRFPELQPALSEEEAQSHLRRGIDALAHRVERLRATGNGVDPLVAAHAFLSLDALLRAGAGAGEFAVRRVA